MGNRCCVSFLLCELDRGIETLLSCLLDELALKVD
jgi:hypothetical protein